MPARIVLRSGILEYSVEFFAEPQFYETNKSRSNADDPIQIINGETVSETENVSN